MTDDDNNMSRWYEVIMRIWNNRKSEVQISECFATKKPRNRIRTNDLEMFDEYKYYFSHMKDALHYAEELASVENIEIEWVWNEDDELSCPAA